MSCLNDYALEDFTSGTKPYEELYNMRSNAFEFQRRQAELTAIAKKTGYIGFVKTYKAYEAAKKGAVVASFNVTEFEGQPMELDCGAWRADEDGITLSSDIIACVHPIMPVKRLVNVDTGIEKLELAYRKGRLWRNIIADKQTLSSANKIVSLSDNGIAVTSETAKSLVRYIHDLENYNYNVIPEIPSVGRLGYIPHYGFSPYVEGLVFDGDASFKGIFSAVREAGKYDVWVAEIKTARAYSLAAKVVIAAAFASALVEPLGVLPFFVHLWGTTSGTGKTVALMAAASVWANPAMGLYIKTFDSTGVGLEWYAAFLNSLPMIIDELQLSRDASGKSKFNVYKLSEGVGRLRGKKSGGVDATATWANCAITSGETPLTQANSGAGALNRVIDVECNDESHRVIENGRHTAAILKANYGHAGRRFIEKLTPDVLDKARVEYAEVMRELSSNDATDKQAMSAALLIVADRLITDWFFDDMPITASDMVGFLQTNASIDINERAYAYMCGWVSANASKFSAASQGEVYGVIENGWAYINRMVFNRAVEDEGYSSKGFLGWLRRKKLIDAREGRGFTRTKKIAGNPTDCVVMAMPIDEEEFPF